jgi:hypothetical protein
MGRHSRASQVAAGGRVGRRKAASFGVHGEIGQVSISVILVPFPPQMEREPAEGLMPVSN